MAASSCNCNCIAGRIYLLGEYKCITNASIRLATLPAVADVIINTIEERRSNLAFANTVLDLIQSTDAVIINRNLAMPNNEFSAAEWVGNARMEARAISAVAYDHQEILSTLTSTKFGDAWLIKLNGEKRIKLYDWLQSTEFVQESRLNKLKQQGPAAGTH